MKDDNLKNIPWDNNNLPTEVEENLIEKRTEICKSCTSLNKYKICKECGCFMPMKVRLEGFGVKCPLDKW